MKRLLGMLVLASVPVSPLWAESVEGLVRTGPVVESAAVPPTNVEFPGVASPEMILRLADPTNGGVLPAGSEGVAFLPGPPDEESFLARVGVEFLEAGTLVEVRVIDGNGVQLNSVVLSAPVPSRWSGNLCEVSLSQNARVELSVKKGSALATAYRGGRDFVTTVPVLSRATVDEARGTVAFSTATSSAPWPLTLVGSSSYSRSYSWPGTSVSFSVSGGPANTCGEIHTYRNGFWVVTSDWVCTNASGYGYKGPWNITLWNGDQTDNPTYIKWPDGNTTTYTWSVIDTVRPTVSINTSTRFTGTASDGQFGAGFSRSWTTVSMWFQDETTSLYWDNHATNCPQNGLDCYVSGSPVLIPATTSLPLTGTTYQLNWWLYPTIYCQAGHRCSASVKVKDIWSEATQRFVWSQ